MKKNVSGFLTKLCITALFIAVSCFAGVQSAYAQVSAMVLQSNGTALQKAGQHLLSGQPMSNGFLGQNPLEESCLRGTFGSGDGRAAWVNYIGRENSLGFKADGILGKPLDIDSYGVQVGVDLYRSKRNQFGVLFDYEGFITSLSQEIGEILRSDNFSGGLYYAKVFANNSDFRALTKFGSAQHWGVHNDTHKVASDSFNTTFEYGKRRFPVQNISWRPYVACDVNYAHVGADEVEGIAFRDTTLTQTYLRLGTDLVAQIKRFTVRADVSYAVDLVSDHLDVWTSDIGKYEKLNLGRQIASAGLTGQYDFNRNSAVFASFGLDAFFDRDSRPYQSTITAGYSFIW